MADEAKTEETPSAKAPDQLTIHRAAARKAGIAVQFTAAVEGSAKEAPAVAHMTAVVGPRRISHAVTAETPRDAAELAVLRVALAHAGVPVGE